MAAASALGAEQRIRQKRGQVTYDALIETCFDLLREREFDEISIADLAQKAGYSVGAFYARFRSKDELFDAMVQQHVQNRRRTRQRQFAETNDARLLHELLDETVRYYWGRRRFWRACLIRSIREPAFWAPMRKLSHEFADALLGRLHARAGRALTSAEEANTRFAVQLAFGLINNTILNRPGPFFLEQELFIENLVRAFKLVSGYDELGAAGTARGAKRSRAGARSRPKRNRG
ncbi:MAG TPA: TetR/AcrR family transcriptional regulator [Gammaproteobacteria bacterium]|nr:TetR/AcrR family transcriptional regulator [Gammaproteobacteria bacterium]